MIVPTGDEKKLPSSSGTPKSVEAKEAYRQDALQMQASPPPYTPSTGEPSSMPSTQSDSRPRFPDRPAMNFTTIIRDNYSIKEYFVIDPTLSMPRELVGNAEKNLRVLSKNGSVSVGIWLVQSGQERGPERNHAVLDCQSENGSVSVNLTSLTDCTYDLNVYSKNGSVTVAIPSNFVGPITIVAHNGSTKLSDGIKERLMTFSDINKKRTCFMGDSKALECFEKGRWNGSSIEIGSENGSIKLSFIGEKYSKGFWSRLLDDWN